MAEHGMDLLKYMPQFERAGKDRDSASEHVHAFREYLDMHDIRTVVNPDNHNN